MKTTFLHVVWDGFDPCYGVFGLREMTGRRCNQKQSSLEELYHYERYQGGHLLGIQWHVFL